MGRAVENNKFRF